MKYQINTLDDFNFKSKVVLARFDLNSPYNKESQKLSDTERIKAAIPTITELSQKGARLTILAHQGGDLEYHNFISTEIHAGVLSDLLGKKVDFIDDVCGPAARQAIKNLTDGQILLLDNVRYMAEEMTLFETKLKLTPQQQAETIVVRKLAPLGQIYVCDAFAAAHRGQPTLVGFEELLPSAMGRLFEREYEVLSKIINSPKHPEVFLLGGAKIEDAFDMMPKVLGDGIADKILTAGLLAHLFMLAKNMDIGEASKKVVYDKKLDKFLDIAKEILSKYEDKILIPVDFASSNNGRIEFGIDKLPSELPILDIGSKTIDLYKKEISKAATVFTNGPAGVFEKPETEAGTRELLTHIAKSQNFSVIGGGDSISAVNKYGLKEDFSYVCTGGGAMVRFLSGEELPVVAALKKSAARFKK
ncbi:MAG: phosphoglycerate kinase [Actinobacteria bacterium]|nr:phosphoglycerate kinase [Actinomycetota bacterium]MCL6088327.1 phosphoglycerate kinase [Actinomycetota bacterium]